MPLTLGVDLGTTTVTCVALDARADALEAVVTLANDAQVTSAADRKLGRSEWDAERIVAIGVQAMQQVAERLGQRAGECMAIGVTGQQHGVVLVDEQLRARSPLINWQDRRALDAVDASGRTYLDEAAAALGPDAIGKHGCRLAAGYMGSTLYWLRRRGKLSAGVRACFIADLLAARLAEAAPATDATLAASSGLLNLATRDWDERAIDALDLPRSLFPPVREAGEPLGALSSRMAAATGLSTGMRVCVPLGDNQAAFVGSVVDRRESVLVNVGTGGQVAAYHAQAVHAWPLETRPFPRGGYLLVQAGLCGGRSVASIEQFFRRVAAEVFDADAHEPAFDRMCALAATVPQGADGLMCDPLFGGTRADPARGGGFSGVSHENLTPAHMARALLEGMARTFHEGYEAIRTATGASFAQIVGSGNGLRENALLARLVAHEFGLPLIVSPHREEAAAGAARLAAIGVGLAPPL